MPDPTLRQSGKLVLLIGTVSFIVGIFGYGSTPVASEFRAGFLDVLLIGVLLLVLGAITWALGRMPSTIVEARVNAGLRSIGFLLFTVGVLGLIAGTVVWTGFGIGAIGVVGLYVAIVGAVVVALSHRKIAGRVQPAVAQH